MQNDVKQQPAILTTERPAVEAEVSLATALGGRSSTVKVRSVGGTGGRGAKKSIAELPRGQMDASGVSGSKRPSEAGDNKVHRRRKNRRMDRTMHK